MNTNVQSHTVRRSLFTLLAAGALFAAASTPSFADKHHSAIGAWDRDISFAGASAPWQSFIPALFGGFTAGTPLDFSGQMSSGSDWSFSYTGHMDANGGTTSWVWGGPNRPAWANLGDGLGNVYGHHGRGDDGQPVGAVPEPAVWLQLLAGIGILGGVARWRRARG